MEIEKKSIQREEKKYTKNNIKKSVCWLCLENIVKSVSGLEANDEQIEIIPPSSPFWTAARNIHTHICRDIWTNTIAYWINTYLSQRNLGITPFIIKSLRTAIALMCRKTKFEAFIYVMCSITTIGIHLIGFW